MHRTISYPLAQAHIADLRRRAQPNTLARAARRVRPGRVAARQALEARPGRGPLGARGRRARQRRGLRSSAT